MSHTDQATLDFLTDYVAVMEAKDYDRLADFFADDVSLTFANAPTVTGKDVVLTQLAAIGGKVDSLAHPLINVWQKDDGVVVFEVDSVWRFPDGLEKTIRACSIFTIVDEQFTDQRIYVDNTPIDSYLPRLTRSRGRRRPSRERHVRRPTSGEGASVLVTRRACATGSSQDPSEKLHGEGRAGPSSQPVSSGGDRARGRVRLPSTDMPTSGLRHAVAAARRRQAVRACPARPAHRTWSSRGRSGVPHHRADRPPRLSPTHAYLAARRREPAFDPAGAQPGPSGARCEPEHRNGSREAADDRDTLNR